VELDAMLCDHAEATMDGKLFINGSAINIFNVPPQPPHFIQVYVAAVVQVPYTATNQPHTLEVELFDLDGPVRPMVPEGMEQPPPVKVTNPFNIGRPPALPAGDVQVFPLAIGFQLPLEKIGLYHFVISVDGTEMKRLPLRVMAPAQPQGFGPASIPGIG
jgi:hypothetical protein